MITAPHILAALLIAVGYCLFALVKPARAVLPVQGHRARPAVPRRRRSAGQMRQVQRPQEVPPFRRRGRPLVRVVGRGRAPGRAPPRPAAGQQPALHPNRAQGSPPARGSPPAGTGRADRLIAFQARLRTAPAW